MNKSSRGGRRSSQATNINVSDLMNSLGNFPEKPDTTPRSAVPSTPKSSRTHGRMSSSSGDVSAMMAALSGGIEETPSTPTSLSVTERNKRRTSTNASLSLSTHEKDSHSQPGTKFY
jgi:hypothetical protein